jgi:hypothetical protein
MEEPVPRIADLESVRSEYLDLSNNVRHHSNLRFAQMTLFVAVTAGLISVLFANQGKVSPLAKTSFKIFGLIVAAAFLVIEERTAAYWRHFQGRAAELEPQLSYRQYSNLPGRKWVTAANATRLLYVVVVVFWIVALTFGNDF